MACWSIFVELLFVSGRACGWSCTVLGCYFSRPGRLTVTVCLFGLDMSDVGVGLRVYRCWHSFPTKVFNEVSDYHQSMTSLFIGIKCASLVLNRDQSLQISLKSSMRLQLVSPHQSRKSMTSSFSSPSRPSRSGHMNVSSRMTRRHQSSRSTSALESL